MEYSLFEFCSIVALITFAYLCHQCIGKLMKNKTNDPPEATGALPVIGHLHLFRGPKPLYQVLSDMADKYGPAFIVRFGSCRTLILSNWEAVKDCFTTNDKVVAARPVNAATEHLGHNYAMFGFAPYGNYWRAVRKITLTELLSPARLEMLKHVPAAEVNTCMKELFTMCTSDSHIVARVDMKKWFGNLNYNIVVQMIASKRYFGSGSVSEEAWRFRDAATQFFHLILSFVPSDMFPFLGWMDIGGYIKAMKKASKEMDDEMDRLVEEHRKRRACRDDCDHDQHNHSPDFMDLMISSLEGKQLEGFDWKTVIKTTSLTMILGGTDTTSTSLTKVLINLLNHKEVLKKVQLELDEQVGKGRVVNELDTKNLVYLQAVIKESFRMTPPDPFLIRRATQEDCILAGYHVPKGTQVLVNAWKVHNDPQVWPEPEKFQPERFLSSYKDIDVKGQHHELIPFGTGRRVCPGVTMALQIMYLTLARLIQGFELRTLNDFPVEMEDGLVSLASDSAPFMVELIPRLTPELY
ncbi:cytochrome P450 CYP82D47-like [Dioscorea cayenensis subsp. rotundata]|uniref:Cytochrome P450 CYP82D47-like n=1 Tax=Dioscorea cayennensis subsp. rotundata TaxID=55577 RepID=A0AB40CKJ1_DIOCR|nr:cytochrome P450 CYP82D47-like [Dioscorea cayenensis subsp. rotundata]